MSLLDSFQIYRDAGYVAVKQLMGPPQYTF